MVGRTREDNLLSEIVKRNNNWDCQPDLFACNYSSSHSQNVCLVAAGGEPGATALLCLSLINTEIRESLYFLIALSNYFFLENIITTL